MQCDRLMLMVGLSFLTLSRWLTTDKRRFMIIPMLCVTIFVILVVWFLLPRVARLMIHTPTAISIFVCLSMVQLMAVFISMRCTLCGHFLQVALTLILVVGYAIAASYIACKIRGLMVTVCPSQFATRRTLFHVLVGCGLLMLKVSRLKLPVIWLLVSMWFRSGDSSKKFKIAEGQWYRYAPSYVSPAYHLLEGFPFIQEPPSGDLQERVLIRHHDYDQCFQSVQLLQWNSQVKFNVTVYRNLPTTRDSIMTS